MYGFSSNYRQYSTRRFSFCCDPPYYYEGIKDKDFYQKPFSFTDHQQLSLELHQATKRGVKWLYTNYETTPILNLFPNYNIIKTKTTISHHLTNKNINQEIIIKNYEYN
ncbi:hypothetical protein [Candidatus Phytoplasma rubi]|uniref:hypothetical protein n=1 Tax=Candidatus Phytoplasma rubi TaxID=399025 RepID=UPI002285729D|nr:hypothetical protein [Candidatus Phytoplasma rubi]